MQSPSVVDTNVILRWLLKDNAELSPKAIAFWETIAAGRGEAILIEAVLVECVFVLSKLYSAPRPLVVAKLLDVVLLSGVIAEHRSAWVEALRLYEQQAISFPDALVLAHAAARKAGVISFDEKLNKIARKRGH